MTPRVDVYEHGAALAQAGAELVSAELAAAAEIREHPTLVLSGGSTPQRLYAALAQRYHEGAEPHPPWSQLHCFWGDERAVAPQHEASNFRMARQSLLDAVPIPADQLHRIPGELGAERAATRYEEELRAFFAGAVPRFDLLLLGMGADGHTASLFPEDATVEEAERWVLATPEHEGMRRVTLTLPVLEAARRILFLVQGEEKAPALARVLDGDPALPAARLLQRRPDARWLVDEAAHPRSGRQ